MDFYFYFWEEIHLSGGSILQVKVRDYRRYFERDCFFSLREKLQRGGLQAESERERESCVFGE